MRDTVQRWQQILADGFGSASALLEYLHIVPADDTALAEQTFPTRVPRGFAQRMEAGNRRDPLLLQVLAQGQEMLETEGYLEDPLAEKAHNPVAGLIHKYQGRVLITFAGACAVHCRYCFRRHFPYQANSVNRHNWAALLAYIHQDSSIHEVILSGGDPLLAADAQWQDFLEQLHGIRHVKTLRIHSRIPVVLPERLSADWLALLAASPLHKVMVLHSNHANELSEPVARAVADFKAIGGHVLNQSVLLRQVNDTVPALLALSHRLFDMGVLPYYLHVLDKVRGSAHFDLPLARALQLHELIRRQLPGYLVPRLVREEAGAPYKTLC
ncbi:MAG: EF-P beta-lysylation protein EpmB [Legionellaceae bacterium]|nr:EF-P beta-lysylation protein EpmB [Legionellaceae bacterium]